MSKIHSISYRPDDNCFANNERYFPIRTTDNATWYAAGFVSEVKRPDLPLDRNRFFWLRVAIPLNPLVSSDNKLRSVVVILHGLAEANIVPYDELMDALAEVGLASIFLPLPNHFTRFTGDAGVFRGPKWGVDPFKVDTAYADHKSGFRVVREHLRQRLLNHPSVWIDGVWQSLKDLEKLTMRISTGNTRSEIYLEPEERRQDIFSSFFSSRTRISLYGYSLGGLITLCALIRDPSQIQSAFLVNTGANLEHVNAEPLFGSKWPELVDKIKQEFEHTERKEFSEEFGLVFIRGEEQQERFAERLQRVSKRTLFLFGAIDDVMKHSEVMQEAPREGLTALILPAVGHWISQGKHHAEWERWRPFLADLIRSFEESHAPDHNLDLVAEMISERVERQSPSEVIKVKIALWDRAEEMFFPCGVSMNIRSQWKELPIFRETVGYCAEWFRSGAEEIGKENVGLLQPENHGYSLDHIHEYRRTGIIGVLCVNAVPTEAADGAPSFGGILVLASQKRLEHSILQTEWARMEILTWRDKLGMEIGKTWRECDRIVREAKKRIVRREE